MLRTTAEDVAWRAGGGVGVGGGDGGGGGGGGGVGSRAAHGASPRSKALALLRAAREARKNEAGMLSLRLLLPP